VEIGSHLIGGVRARFRTSTDDKLSSAPPPALATGAGQRTSVSAAACPGPFGEPGQCAAAATRCGSVRTAGSSFGNNRVNVVSPRSVPAADYPQWPRWRNVARADGGKTVRGRPALADTPDDDAASLGLSVEMATSSLADAIRPRHGGEDALWWRTG